jgi:hypothetical protein
LLHQQLDANGNTVAMLISDDHRNVSCSNNMVYGRIDGIGLNVNNIKLSERFPVAPADLIELINTK